MSTLQPDKVPGDQLAAAGGFAAAFLLLVPLCAASAWLVRGPAPGEAGLAGQRA
jgi:hypothetical protein